MNAKKTRWKRSADWPGGHATLPRVFYTTDEFRTLSPQARSLLIEFTLRYKGNNNGNLEMTEEQYASAGLGTPTTLHRYKAELINRGWIVVTRQGGLGKCNLYALTYLPIQDTGKQYDHPIKAGVAASHLWKAENRDLRDARKQPTRRNRLDKLQRARRPDQADSQSRLDRDNALGV